MTETERFIAHICAACKEAMSAGVSMFVAIHNTDVFPPVNFFIKLPDAGIPGGFADKVLRRLQEETKETPFERKLRSLRFTIVNNTWDPEVVKVLTAALELLDEATKEKPFVDPLAESIRQQLTDDGTAACQSDCEDQYSNDTFSEHCAANEYEFYENGVLVPRSKR